MKIQRTTRHIYPPNMFYYDMLRDWLGGHSLCCVIETNIWVVVFGFRVYRLYRYWLVQHHAYQHNPHPKGFYPEYNIPVVKWQWMDKEWIKHFSDISSKIRKSRQRIN